MDIQVNKFREALKLFQEVVPRKKVTLEILHYIMLEDGKVAATDLETYVALPMPEAAGFSCLLPYAEVVKVLQYVPGTDTLRLTIEKGEVTMSWSDGNAKFYVGKKTTADYPSIPDMLVDAEAMVDVDTLIPAMDEVIRYAATDDSRPVLKGVWLTLAPEQSQVAAGDGFRLAHRHLPVKFPKEVTCIVPLESIDVLKALWQRTPRTIPTSGSLANIVTARKQALVSIDPEKKGLRFQFGDAATAFVKLVPGTPPNYLQLLPKPEDKRQVVASVLGMDLDLAVRRLQRLANDGSGIIRMVFKDGVATVSARSEEHGSSESSFKTVAMEGEGRVAMNVKYLLDYLKGKDGIVTITVYSPSSPVLFRYGKFPNVVIMPMFVQWGDEPVEPAKTEPPTAATEVNRSEAVASTPPPERELETEPPAEEESVEDAEEPETREAETSAEQATA